MTSRYFLLNENFLLEYIYNSDTINTATRGFNKLENNLDNRNYFFSDSGAIATNDNVIDRSYVALNRVNGTHVFLDQDLVVPYNDYESELTDTVNLPVDFNGNDYNLVYDTVRVHFKSGFTFPNSEGFYINVAFQTNGPYEVNVATLVYLKTDTYKRLNPNTLIIGEAAYDGYIDIKIPSLNTLKQEQINFPADVDKMWYKLSDGQGINVNSNILINFGVIERRYTQNINVALSTVVTYTFFEFQTEVNFAINSVDQYSLVSAGISEADDGDYYNLQALYDGSAISNYIASLNAELGGNWIILHDIQVFEQVGLSNIITSNYSFIQDTDYDEPILFRPVIKNASNAVSYTIRYAIRLYNRTDNQQIYKQSQIISTTPRKYGKKLVKIDIGSVPVIQNIYNKIETQEPTFTNKSTTNIFKTEKIVLNYFENTNIAVSVSNTTLLNTPTDEGKIFNQNNAVVKINDTDTYLKFTIYEEVAGAMQNKNVNNIGDILLLFIDNNQQDVLINQQFDNQFDPTNGQILFKIPSELTKEIIKFNNSNFYIVVNNNNEKSVLYAGSWVYSGNQNENNVLVQNINKDVEILTLKEQITALQQEISNLNNTINNKDKELQKATILTDKTGKIFEPNTLTKLNEKEATKTQNINNDIVVSAKKSKLNKFL